MKATDRLLLRLALSGATQTSIPVMERLLEEALSTGILVVDGQTRDGRVLYRWNREA